MSLARSSCQDILSRLETVGTTTSTLGARQHINTSIVEIVTAIENVMTILSARLQGRSQKAKTVELSC